MTDSLLGGKVVLIAGAGRPLGRLIALGFAKAGASLALHDLSPVHLDETFMQARALGAECRTYTGDIGKGLPSRALVADVLEDWQRLDVLVTCLHAAPSAGLLELDEWDWTRTLEINLTGPICRRRLRRRHAAQGSGALFSCRPTRLTASAGAPASQAGLSIGAGSVA